MILQTMTVAEEAAAMNGSVEQLTESSIKLAEAAANFGALKLMFGVFIVFIFIMMLFYLYQLVTYNKKIGDIHQSSKKIESYFQEASDKTLGKSQANILVRRSFNSLSQSIKYIILRTRLENKFTDDEEGREVVRTKVTKTVENEYAELTSFLANFDCGDKKLSEILNNEDTQIIADFVVEQILIPRDRYVISNMDRETDILLNGIKLDVLKNF